MNSVTGARIAKNSLFNLARTLVAAPLTLALTPYVLGHLGTEQFGIWALVGVLSSYFALSDFGITQTLIKFMAEYEARADAQQLNRLLNTALVIYLAISLVLCGLLVLVMPPIVDHVLNIPPPLQAKALPVLRLAVGLFFVNMTMGVFGSLILGFQRMGYSNAIAIGNALLVAAGTVVVLERGGGLMALMVNNAVGTAFAALASFAAARRLFPAMRLRLVGLFSREMLRVILGFSWKVQVTNVSQLMVFQIDRIILSHFAGLAAVSSYELANRIASQARALIASMFTPMIPAASALNAAEEHGRVSGLYRRAFKYMVLADLPLSVLVIALARPFVRTWLGGGYGQTALTMQLLMAAFMLNLLTGPGSFLLNGINKPEVNMRASLFGGLLNLALCLSLVRWIGYYGVVVGLSASLIISGAYFVWMLHRSVPGLPRDAYRVALVRPTLLTLTAGGALLLLDRRAHLHGYALLCAIGAVYLAVVGIGIVFGNYLDAVDRESLGRLSSLRRRRA